MGLALDPSGSNPSPVLEMKLHSFHVPIRDGTQLGRFTVFTGVPITGEMRQ